jgi:hypothetical protein
MGLLNHTTKIPAEQTIAEIQAMLTRHGVNAMMTELDGPHVSSVSFRMKVGEEQRGFRLPCNWKAVEKVLAESAGKRNIYDQKRLERILAERKAQAIRTAWRIIHTWVKAQLALVEVNMVTVPQVFLPYAVMADGRTLAEHVETDPNRLLGNGQ